jgi:hypothetical protein
MGDGRPLLMPPSDAPLASLGRCARCRPSRRPFPHRARSRPTRSATHRRPPRRAPRRVQRLRTPRQRAPTSPRHKHHTGTTRWPVRPTLEGPCARGTPIPCSPSLSHHGICSRRRPFGTFLRRRGAACCVGMRPSCDSDRCPLLACSISASATHARSHVTHELCDDFFVHWGCYCYIYTTHAHAHACRVCNNHLCESLCGSTMCRMYKKCTLSALSPRRVRVTPAHGLWALPRGKPRWRSTGEPAAAKWSASPGAKVGRVAPRGAPPASPARACGEKKAQEDPGRGGKVRG